MEKKNVFWKMLFVLPTVLVFALFFIYPLATVIGSSFTDWKLAEPVHFVGLQNYIGLFTNDAIFGSAFWNTLAWMLMGCVVTVPLALAVSLLTARMKKFDRFVRTVYLIPNVIASAVMARLFFALLNPSYGVVNQIIRLLGFSDFNVNWYFDNKTAFFAVAFTAMLFAGVSSLLISSELTAIPDTIKEAARVDGANGFQLQWYIILPLLKNVVATCLILSATGQLKAYETIALTTEGGPGFKTMNLSLLLYRYTMTSGRYGYGNAVGVIMLAIGLVAILVINRLFSQREQSL